MDILRDKETFIMLLVYHRNHRKELQQLVELLVIIVMVELFTEHISSLQLELLR
tara:strand:+ start:59 stop:220 length:162 start_codon:yes stop_codon:yes gene_type:complete